MVDEGRLRRLLQRIRDDLVVIARFAGQDVDAIRILARQGVISRELAATVAKAVGFRNLLVHQYSDVDDRLALQNLAHLDDLEHFVDSVTRWAFKG